MASTETSESGQGQTFATKRTTVPAAEKILGGYFPVLDHGFVALIDYMGTDVDVERAARLSYSHGTRQVSQTRGLVRYLRRHRHTTPSEMVELKFHCAMPIFVARQWIRHRTASVNEMSARYSLMPLLFYTPDLENFQLQSKSNNQGREGGAPAEVYREAVERWEHLREESGGTYGWLLEEDLARELARLDLPLSIYTQWYWKMDLHNLLHFLSLRCDGHAQWEIRQFANVMAAMVKRVAPLSYEAWVDYELTGAHLSRGELKLVRKFIAVNEDGSLRDMMYLPAVGEGEAEEYDLSKREFRELVAKLQPQEVPNFELDLSTMKSAEEVGKKMEKATPSTFE